MTESPANLRRLALEIIATLVNIKRVSADQLLRRANVDENLIRRFLTDRDPATGAKASKRVAGAMVLDELAKEGRDLAVIGKLIEIAAGWAAFHLAGDEYMARATVQKALEVSRSVAEQEDRARGFVRTCMPGAKIPWLSTAFSA
jgi:hypothetical protein